MKILAKKFLCFSPIHYICVEFGVKMKEVFFFFLFFFVFKEAEAQYTNHKMARLISINDNELRDTIQRLARLVREVDKCIALLNE